MLSVAALMVVESVFDVILQNTNLRHPFFGRPHTAGEVDELPMRSMFDKHIWCELSLYFVLDVLFVLLHATFVARSSYCF